MHRIMSSTYQSLDQPTMLDGCKHGIIAMHYYGAACMADVIFAFTQNACLHCRKLIKLSENVHFD